MASVQSETVAIPDVPVISGAWPPEIAKFIELEIAQGEYSSEKELVCDALRQLRERKIQELDREIQLGIDDVEQGRVIHFADHAALSEHMQGIWQRVSQRAAKSKNNVP